jgi:hypothetical protein
MLLLLMLMQMMLSVVDRWRQVTLMLVNLMLMNVSVLGVVWCVLLELWLSGCLILECGKIGQRAAS